MENNKINKKRKIARIIWIIITILYLIVVIGYWFIPNISIAQKGIFFGTLTFTYILSAVIMIIDVKAWLYKWKDKPTIGLYKNEGLYVWNQLKKRYLIIPIIKIFSDLAMSSLVISSVILLKKESKILETLSEFLTSTGFILTCVAILPTITSIILFYFYKVTLIKIFGRKNFLKDVVVTKNIYLFPEYGKINWFIWFHKFFLFGLILTCITYLDIEKNNPNILETETKKTNRN